MTNDTEFCDRPGWPNPLTPSIQSELQEPISLDSKAAHRLPEASFGTYRHTSSTLGWPRRRFTSLVGSHGHGGWLCSRPSRRSSRRGHALSVFPKERADRYMSAGTLCRDANGVLYVWHQPSSLAAPTIRVTCSS